MVKTIHELRKKPQLLFTLNDTDFLLIDVYNPSNNGNFKYNSIDSVELVKGKTNWFISIISLIIDFIFGSGGFDVYKEKSKLIIHLENLKLEILLFKVDKRDVEVLTERLKSKSIQ